MSTDRMVKAHIWPSSPPPNASSSLAGNKGPVPAQATPISASAASAPKPDAEEVPSEDSIGYRAMPTSHTSV